MAKARKSLKVLILGGTKFMGRETANCLRESGSEVTTFSHISVPADPGTNHIVGNRSSENDLKKALKADTFDVVIDNLAFTADDVNLVLPLLKSSQRYILTSSVSVYRYRRPHILKPYTEDIVDHETRPPGEEPSNVHWKYAHGKKEAEHAVLKQKKIPWTIVRPPVVCGPNDSKNRSYWYLLRLLDGGPVLLADSGNHSFRLVYSKDMGRAFAAIALSEKSVSQIYNVAQKEIITLREYLEKSASALGKKPNFVSAPVELLGEELAGPYANMPNYIVDSSKIQNELGFTATPFDDFVRETAVWFRDHWQGDRKTILESRAKELAFAQRWERALELMRGPITDPVF
jgi:nucleoside-diphosphate-sugar epimerase